MGMNIFEQIKKINSLTQDIEDNNNLELLSESVINNVFTKGLAWNPNSPNSVNTDFDNDGIVDALDYYLGQGAYGPNDR